MPAWCVPEVVRPMAPVPGWLVRLGSVVVLVAGLGPRLDPRPRRAAARPWLDPATATGSPQLLPRVPLPLGGARGRQVGPDDAHRGLRRRARGGVGRQVGRVLHEVPDTAGGSHGGGGGRTGARGRLPGRGR